MIQSDCLILLVAAIRKPRSDHQFSHAISKAQWGRHQRDSLIHRTWAIGEREGEMDLEIKKTNSTSLTRKAGERQKRFQTEIDKRIRFQGQKQIVIGVLTSKRIPFLIRSFVGRDLGGSLFLFFIFFSFFVP